jgi:phosphoribosylformimino-5-aminoimidazole carboxamide ribotide isomerase
MIVIPAIDIRDGKCVRLTQGNYSKEEVFSTNAIETAKRWQKEGAELLHIIDLDGARSGSLQNLELVSEIVDGLTIQVQVGGGIKNCEIAKKLFDAGVARVVIGTAALRNPDLVKRLVAEYGAQAVCVAVDYKSDGVAIEGWGRSLNISPFDYSGRIEELGAGFTLFTCIERDGMLSGADIGAIRRIVRSTKMKVIAAGGVSSIDDIRKIKETGAYGVVVGKALYRGKLDLREVVACLQKE